MPWYKLEKSPTLEALARWEFALGSATVTALMGAAILGMEGLVHRHDPWLHPGRIGFSALMAVSILPSYAVRMLRERGRPGRGLRIAGLVAHLAWIALGIASGPKVGAWTVLLVLAVAAHLEYRARRRARGDEAEHEAGGREGGLHDAPG